MCVLILVSVDLHSFKVFLCVSMVFMCVCLRASSRPRHDYLLTAVGAASQTDDVTDLYVITRNIV